MAQDSITISKKAVVGAALFVALLGGSWFGFKQVEATPQYSLYLLQQSVKAHDLDSFNRHFDTKAVTDSLVSDMWSDMKAEMQAKAAAQASNNPWEKLGQSMAMGMIEMMRPQVAKIAQDTIEEQIKKSLLQLGNTQATAVAPEFDLRELNVQGKAAVASVVNKGNGYEMRFMMQQGETGFWRITALDYQTLKKQKKA